MGINYSISELSRIIQGELVQGDENSADIDEVLIDSRRLARAKTALFVALVTERNDGHKYIGELFDKGVRNFLVSNKSSAISHQASANFIIVPDTLLALQELAACHRNRFRIPVIGITGSNGKTVIKEWLFQLLSPDYKIVRSPKSYNSQVGVPLSVLEMNPEHNLAIFEAGISEPGEMTRLESIIHPTIGIFTNIGQAHDENFKDENEKATEKLELFRNAETLIYCSDHIPVNRAVSHSSFTKNKRLVTWSKRQEAALFIEDIRQDSSQTTINGSYKETRIRISIPFTDEASVENAIHCWLLMLDFGYHPDIIDQRMKTLLSIAMRLELKEAINRCSLINDSYSLDINSLSIALDFLNQQKQHDRKTVILSDILQSGREPDQLYTELARLLSDKKINKLIGIGKEISKHAALFHQEKVFFETTGDFLSSFPFSTFHDETILLKGARVFEFEKIGNVLEQKVHETVLEINLDALVHNLNYYRSMLAPGTKTMVMVKAFSYGTGSFEIANLLQFHHVDYLAVAYADEGVELRKAGISLPVMVMNPEEQSFDLLMQYDLEPEIYNFRTLNKLEEAISRQNGQYRKPINIHIKLDSGMHRLGFEPEDIDTLVRRIKLNPGIHIQSVFSHLAASEASLHDEFTRWQIRQFKIMCDSIMAGIDFPVMRHILNSAGISRFRDDQMEMVRLGIGLYGVGYDSGEQSRLRNVSTLKSTVSQIKFVKSGETIGYNRAGKAVVNSIIAIVPIGYADGLNRRLSNGTGRLFIDGKPAPVIGNICMDLCMVDITHIMSDPDGRKIREGDEVIIFGKDYPINSLANDLGTIPYEILTGISRRVKRVYFHE